MAWRHWLLQIDHGIAVLTLDVADSSVNVLSFDVLDELADVTSALETDQEIKGLILRSGKAQGFVYGANINEFERLKDEDSVMSLLDKVHGIFNRIATLPYPSVAAVDGFALGGGLELALLCDRVIASNKAQLAFPEVKLGLMPGYGGTGRAYRRIGAEKLLMMLLTGKMIAAEEALNIGLIDAIAANDKADDLLLSCRDVLTSLGGIKPPKADAGRIDTDISNIIAKAESELFNSCRPDHTPAPFSILDHVNEFSGDPEAMSEGEKLIFTSLMMSSASRGLRRSFQLSDKIKKTAKGSSGIERVHVVGAGVMGGDIAAVAALAGFDVSLSDVSAEAVTAAINRGQKLFERRLKLPEKIAPAMARLTADVEGAGIKDADLIIEAVSEQLEIKQDVFKAIAAVAKDDAILATNTSSLPLEDIEVVLPNPVQLVGLHFFNPVPVLPLVEVIYTKATDEAVIKRCMQFAGALKKMPVKCRSAAGFIVNRALLPYINGAVELMLSGVNADKIDEALLSYGMPMGPIELADQIGLDVMLHASRPLGIAGSVMEVYANNIADGNLGRKTGSGFYEWDGKKAQRPRHSYDSQELAALASDLLAPMLTEARQVVADGVAASADDVDAALIFGIGFPGFRGGILYANES